MIRLTRTRTAAAVPASLRGAKRREKEAELLRLWRAHVADPAKKPVWKTTYWKAGKPRLKKDAAGKCAYCESPTDVVAHGDVEHFRPKSVYWWLAYCFDNHLFSCQVCNQSYKGDNFPRPPGVAAFAGPAVTKTSTDAELDALVDTFAPDAVDVLVGFALATHAAACAAEQAGLPDPYVVDPEPFFKWEADATNKEVWLRAADAAHAATLAACETYLGLNREELRRWRWTLAYEDLSNYRDILRAIDDNGGPAQARALTVAAIKGMMAADKPYAAMVRYFVTDKWALAL